jgi:Tol biopolymer transport system component
VLKTHIIGSLVLSLLLSTTPVYAQTTTRADTGNAVTAAALPSMYEPNISPDGSEIAFVSGGDIWTVASAGGEARLLVSHTATNRAPSIRRTDAASLSSRRARAQATSTCSTSPAANSRA